MPRHPLVLAAMSGGVDSSVAALLLARQGQAVMGATMEIWCPREEPPESGPTGCCNARAALDAAAVCDRLGIPHQVFSFREAFEHEVIEPFVADYARGWTPNPCINCNRTIKWGRLLARAQALGASHLATGHYARIEQRPEGTFRLLRGVDRAKDQSYALYMLRQRHLERTCFPVGNWAKQEVRQLAAAEGLPVSERPESQEICFVADDDHFRFVRARSPDAGKPGPILDLSGNVLGEHRGIAAYTVGQRRGLGLGGPQRHFVVEIDADRNAVIVGSEADTQAAEILVEDVSYTAHLDGQECPSYMPGEPFEAEVTTRYRGQVSLATVTPGAPGTATVRFRRPQRAPAPGQAAVFYRGDEVLGGGTIARCLRWANR